jgi:hypothetical protein
MDFHSIEVLLRYLFDAMRWRGWPATCRDSHFTPKWKPVYSCTLANELADKMRANDAQMH